MGKKEVLRSLGTGDRRAANLEALKLVADLYEEWQRMLASLASSPFRCAACRLKPS